MYYLYFLYFPVNRSYSDIFLRLKPIADEVLIGEHSFQMITLCIWRELLWFFSRTNRDVIEGNYWRTCLEYFTYAVFNRLYALQFIYIL